MAASAWAKSGGSRAGGFQANGVLCGGRMWWVAAGGVAGGEGC